MLDKAQVRAVIKLLSNSDLITRPALRQIFEKDGWLWATDGYVAFKIAEIKDELKGKRITLDDLKAWNKAHTKASDRIGNDIFTDNEFNQPDMLSLFECEFEPSADPWFDATKLKLACDLLEITGVRLETSKANRNLYKVVPLDENEPHVMTRAMESQVYIMGLQKT